MSSIRWEINEHRGEIVASLWVGHACIYSRELEAKTAPEREMETRRIRHEFGEAVIEDWIERGDYGKT